MNGLALFTTAQISRLLSISINRVNQLAHEGVFIRVARGLYDPAQVATAYVRHMLEGAKAQWAVDGADKARLSAAKARLAELKLQQEEGRMISVTAVTIAGAAVMERVRTRLLAVPRKVAPRWATAKSATEAETLVRREIEAGLMELSRLPTLGESAAADDATNAGLEFRPGPLR